MRTSSSGSSKIPREGEGMFWPWRFTSGTTKARITNQNRMFSPLMSSPPHRVSFSPSVQYHLLISRKPSSDLLSHKPHPGTRYSRRRSSSRWVQSRQTLLLHQSQQNGGQGPLEAIEAQDTDIPTICTDRCWVDQVED